MFSINLSLSYATLPPSKFPHLTSIQDADLREVLPSIMEILSQRLNNLYMAVAERNPQDSILRLIAPLARRARELHSV